MQLLQLSVAVLLIFAASLSIYRLYFSPLSRIPGPKLAALTYWYEFYFDGWLGGKYIFKIKEFHEKYGPIVRINPHHVHINDIGFYDTIYAPGGTKHPRNKIRWMALHFDSMFDTFDAALHRKRRAAVASPFSKQSIRALEPAIVDIITHVIARFEKLAGTGAVVGVHSIWNSLTQEVIGQYCFGANKMSDLREGGDDAQFIQPDHVVDHVHAWGRMFPWVFDMLAKIPLSVLGLYDERLGAADKFNKEIADQIARVLESDQPHVGNKNVFHEMRDSKHLPSEDKQFSYYQSEAGSFIGGGTETTASALTTLTYFVLENPDVLRKLREELRTVMPLGQKELPPTSTLEGLPYLTGVIQEGIRLSFSVPSRLPRTAPTEELVYNGYRLPPGTVMSASSYLLHTDEKVFPEPFEFRPERWINDTDHIARRQFVAFSRGARSCIGINLAYVELYAVVAAVFSRLELKLFETSRRDVELESEGFIGYRPKDSKGVRVQVVSCI
ncbi:cytochrome P450 [Xylaria bambusicola]|uniref:cytochrome P450 n=1 Tax=Xylaria bambusicola TaxID=326684 RepID=UPI002007F648|nr:cytochrome P450 [Xylaria bambusicola]KAI0515411.1 cytochrome P450 [Xylaria bambusicola]